MFNVGMKSSNRMAFGIVNEYYSVETPLVILYVQTITLDKASKNKCLVSHQKKNKKGGGRGKCFLLCFLRWRKSH